MVGGGVALHGMLGGPGDWQGLLPESLAWQTPNLWDWWRGAGAVMSAGAHDPGVGLDLWAEQFDAACGSATGACLLGYSLGGRLALHAWLRRPQRWRQVWIVSAHPGLEDQNQRSERRLTDQAWTDRLLAETPEDFLSAWDRQGALAGGTVVDVGGRLERVRQWRQQMALALRHWSLGWQRPLWDEIALALQEHDTELHWVTGTGDGKFTEIARQLQQRAPGVIRHQFAGAGHRVPWDQPQDWLRILESCLTPMR